MYTIFWILHMLACLVLVGVILLQFGQMGGFGGVFGGGGVDQIFSSSSGAKFFKQVTIGAALVFVATTIALTVITAGQQSASLVR
jgi:preprotein translocase subunit SecG